MKIIHILRKPLSEGTVADNVLEHGTGGLNIDAARVGTDDNLNGGAYAENASERHDGAENWRYKRGGAGRSSLPGDTREGATAGMFQPSSTVSSNFVQPTGRFPANVILQHLDGCRCEGTRPAKGYQINRFTDGAKPFGGAAGHPYESSEMGCGVEEVWVCVEGCPVRTLDTQSGILKTGAMDSITSPESDPLIYGTYGSRRATAAASEGGASRFFKQVASPTEPTEETKSNGETMKITHILRKPLSEGTVADNVLEHGTGGLNIDGSRVAAPGETISNHSRGDESAISKGIYGDSAGQETHQTEGQKSGRWPANVILQHLEGCRCEGVKKVPSNGNFPAQQSTASWKMSSKGKALTPERSYRDEGKETVANWICVEGCPVLALDEQSGVLAPQGGQKHKDTKEGSFLDTGFGGSPTSSFYGDQGGASRFFKQVASPTEPTEPTEATEPNEDDQSNGETMKITHILRKPLSEGTVADNVLEHGTGALNIDASRVAGVWSNPKPRQSDDMRGGNSAGGNSAGYREGHYTEQHSQGRWPANVILQHLEGCRCEGVKKVSGGSYTGKKSERDGLNKGHDEIYGDYGSRSVVTHADEDGKETVANWICAEGCPVLALDEQSGVCPSTGDHPSTAKNTSIYRPGQPPMAQGKLYADTGGASRFFKQATGMSELVRYLDTLIRPADNPAILISVDSSEDQVQWEDIDAEAAHGVILSSDLLSDEVFRVLKPGGHLLLMGTPQDFKSVCRMEDLGFEVRDSICVFDSPEDKFHYIPKAAKSEKESGCWEFEGQQQDPARSEDKVGGNTPSNRGARKRQNSHPTVKPIAVMEALLKDVPKDAPIVDPFMGSGTTMIACLKTGHNGIGIEMNPEYLKIADARVRHWDHTHNGWVPTKIESDVEPTAAEEIEEFSLADFFRIG
jgi:hypothetical protein